MTFCFDTTYLRLPERLYERVAPTPVTAPRLLALADEQLIAALGVTHAWLTSDAGVALLGGNAVVEGSTPIALAYAGHQFGNFVPQLGDGRAVLLGEVVGADGKRRDVQLKGSGRTRFSRGGDGRAALGPVLRELVVSEAMFRLGVPTTRVLAAVASGEPVYRERALPGAILTRVAASHLRIGTFEFVSARRDRESLEALVDYALERHAPDAPHPEGKALALFDAVAGAQVALVSHWLAVGFVHGVMNTDNMALSGETIDYGPCAFLDTYRPTRTFSSIDQHGRYAYANQPNIMLWNLARFAETLIPLIDDGASSAIAKLTARIEALPAHFDTVYGAALCNKIGIADPSIDDAKLAFELLDLMAEQRADYTICFRSLTHFAGGDAPFVFGDAPAFAAWIERWLTRIGQRRREASATMRAVNPAIIPRNHRVEDMITAALVGDLGPLERLRRALTTPYEDTDADAELREPPGDEQWRYQTFCGT